MTATQPGDPGQGAAVQPRFSILTTAYRTEAYLEATIVSVRAQTLAGWEMIVVDNGRSEAIAEIVRRQAREDSRIRLVRQENQGYAGGVNAAALHASGAYLCLLDSDDQYLPTFCEAVEARLSTEPGLDAVCVDIVRFRDSQDFDNLGGYRTLPSRKQHLDIEDVLSGRVPYTGAIHRDAWAALGGLDTDPTIEADVLLWSRLASAYRVGVVHKKLARVRERAGSESRDHAKLDAFQSRLIRSFELAGRLLERPEDRRAAAATVREFGYHAALRRSRAAFLAGDVAVARTEAREAMRQHRTVRILAVRILLRLPQRLLRFAHRAKQVVGSRGNALAGRLSTWWRARVDHRA